MTHTARRSLALGQETTHIRLDVSIKAQCLPQCLKSDRFLGLHHARSCPATGRQAVVHIDIAGPRVHAAPINHLPVPRRSCVA